MLLNSPTNNIGLNSCPGARATGSNLKWEEKGEHEEKEMIKEQEEKERINFFLRPHVEISDVRFGQFSYLLSTSPRVSCALTVSTHTPDPLPEGYHVPELSTFLSPANKVHLLGAARL